MKLIACNSNVPLAQEISKRLNIELTQSEIKTFADNEIFVEILESVRGEDVFIIQSTAAPVNNHLMELLIAIDALKRGSAKRITAVVPYYGYARQDRKSGPRTPISAKLVANLITKAGADRVLTIDLHAAQIQGFFDIPVDNLFAGFPFRKHIEKNYSLDELMIVSPDVGGVVRARSTAKRLGVDLAIIDKRREKPGTSEVMNIIGEVEGKNCLLMDDIIDSGGTLCNAADALIKAGANNVDAYITHGVLSEKAFDRINKSSLRKLFITNSIQPQKTTLNCKKIELLTIAPLLADAIKRITEERSVSYLFTE